MNKTGSRLNGDFVSAQLHIRMDSAAQFGLSKLWRAETPFFSPIKQIINRAPYVPAAGAYVAGSIELNHSNKNMKLPIIVSLKNLLGLYVLTPFEQRLLDELEAMLEPKCKNILKFQLSNFTMVRRLIRHLNEPNSHGYTNFYTTKYGQDLSNERQIERFLFLEPEELFAVGCVKGDFGVIQVQFWLVNGILFTIEYRSEQKIYYPTNENYEIEMTLKGQRGKAYSAE